MEALAQIAAQLGLDQTFYYLFGLFIVLYAVLSVVYLKPHQRLIQERKKSIEGVKKEASDLYIKADETFNAYRERLKGVTHDAQQYIRQSEDAGRKEESKIVGEASAKAKAALQSAQQQLDQQHRAAVSSISSEIAGLAEQIVQKVLGHASGK